MKITIVGVGYVGLVTATVLADKGNFVTCFDIDQGKISKLQSEECVVYEDGLEELICDNSRRLQFTSDINSACKNTEVFFICVGTPEKSDGSANLDFVFQSIDSILENIDRDVLLVIKSTVPIGTNNKIQQYINDRQDLDFKIDVVSNPEFLSQGTALKNMMNADRIIIGTDSETSRNIMGRIYEKFDAPIIYTDRCSAEMIKYASNDFLALKISYINEIANLCELLGANIKDVAKGMGMDPRIGDKFLNAGIGYGGSCFPKDTKALCSLSDSLGYELKTVKAAIEVNERQKLRLIEKSRKYYDSLEGLTVAVLGLTFKPGTDDLREAPSLVNIPRMLEEGAYVKAWDPVGIEKFKVELKNNNVHNKKLQFCKEPIDALIDADICFVFTEWDEIKKLKREDFLTMNKALVLDGRNCICLSNEDDKICYLSIGV